MKEFFNRYDDTLNALIEEQNTAVFADNDIALVALVKNVEELCDEIIEHCDLTEEERAELLEMASQLINDTEFAITGIRADREEGNNEIFLS